MKKISFFILASFLLVGCSTYKSGTTKKIAQNCQSVFYDDFEAELTCYRNTHISQVNKSFSSWNINLGQIM